MSNRFRDLCESLQSLGEFCGLNFVWRFVDNSMLLRIPPEQAAHENAFCRSVKREPCRKLHLCIREHRAQAFEEAHRLRRPFIFRCHAGALELVVPLLADDRLVGVLFAGTFADPAGTPPRQVVQEHAQLPRPNEEKLLALGDFLFRTIDVFTTGIEFPATRPRLVPDPETNDARVIQGASFMRLHCTEQIRAEDVARVAGLSTSRFLHLFTTELGITYSDWLQRLRLSEAQRLVEGTDIPFSSIAEICGITDQSRMAALFRRYLGESPRKLRAKARSVSLCNMA